MAKSPGVLSRLFGRSKHPVVSSLATAALNRPLLVYPLMAESIIAGYLSGTITSADTQLVSERVQVVGPPAAGAELLPGVESEPKPEEAKVRMIGVINISGGLVNRPMPGASGPGPASYAAIRAAFDLMLEDDSVSDIVLRIESPGGMVAGCFDLSDHIYASRGRKPIHALVDDYAYSAAFALAAACDDIWVSRTGGVGSVGAVAYHEEFSGWNAKVGRTVTAVHSGEHKIDFSVDFPLKASAKEWLQASVDTARQAFAEAVARYRGLSVEAVLATEAGIFEGQPGIDAGFATKLGTWHDLMAQLGASGAAAPDQSGDEGEDDVDLGGDPAPAPTADGSDAAVEPTALSEEQNRLLERGAMVDAVSAAKLPAPIAVALIESFAAGEDVAARIATAQEVISLCKTAKAEDRAAEFVRRKADLAQVRSDLVEAKAVESDKVSLQTTLPAGVGNTAQVKPTSHQGVYSRRRAAAAGNGK